MACRIIFAAAFVLFGAHLTFADTNYVMTPNGYWSYEAPGMGNAMEQHGG